MPNRQPSVEDSIVSLIVLKASTPAQKHLACKQTSIKGTEYYYIGWNKPPKNFQQRKNWLKMKLSMACKTNFTSIK